MTYVKKLEDQNEELQKKLADTELLATEGTMAFKVLYYMLNNCEHSCDIGTDRMSFNITINDVNISSEDIGMPEANALGRLLYELRIKRTQNINIKNFAESFKNFLY